MTEKRSGEGTTEERIGEAMTEDQVASLLESAGHGVLSLAADDRAYGIPISYGYDRANDRIILEFVNAGESKKEAFAGESDEVTLTVYNYEGENAWESVVVTGPLHPIDPAEVANRSAAQFFAQADDAAGELRWSESEGVDRRWYEIRISDASGRHGGSLPHQQSRGLLRFSRFDRRRKE